MLERHNQAIAKLDAILAYIISEVEALPPPPITSPEVKANTIAAYTGFIDKIKAGLSDYASDITKKSAQMKMLIMGMLQNGILASYTCDNLTLRPAETDYPGFDNLQNIYSCDGLYNMILNASPASLYEGPIETIPLPEIFEPGEYALNDMALKAEKAEQTEAVSRDALIQWLNASSSYNVFMLLFESPINGRVHTTARDLASGLYLDNHARDVIYEFNLDVYIPVALRLT